MVNANRFCFYYGKDEDVIPLHLHLEYSVMILFSACINHTWRRSPKGMINLCLAYPCIRVQSSFEPATKIVATSTGDVDSLE